MKIPSLVLVIIQFASLALFLFSNRYESFRFYYWLLMALAFAVGLASAFHDAAAQLHGYARTAA
ncbi:MAG: hypothetical protein QM664_02160 [Flavihumibacter sp.]